MSIIAIYFAFPYWVLLQMLRLCRTTATARSLAKKCIEPFLWANTAWLTLPLVFVEYAIWGNLGWRWPAAFIVTYLVVALVLHSAVAHSTKGAFDQWEAARD